MLHPAPFDEVEMHFFLLMIFYAWYFCLKINQIFKYGQKWVVFDILVSGQVWKTWSTFGQHFSAFEVDQKLKIVLRQVFGQN